jgi:hypothetical protein
MFFSFFSGDFFFRTRNDITKMIGTFLLFLFYSIPSRSRKNIIRVLFSSFWSCCVGLNQNSSLQSMSSSSRLNFLLHKIDLKRKSKKAPTLITERGSNLIRRSLSQRRCRLSTIMTGVVTVLNPIDLRSLT